jgi:tetratricopeptide (TPR) repeat protein
VRGRAAAIAAWLGLAAGAAGCGAPERGPGPAPAAERPPRTLRQEVALRLGPELAGERSARRKAERISRYVFGERRLQETMTCLDLAALLAHAVGTKVARTPHHAVIAVEGEGGPLFLDPADPGAILGPVELSRAHPWPDGAAAARIYGRPLAAPEFQADEDANLAARELEAGRIAEALELAESALRAEPELPEALVNCAAALVASGRAAEAEPLLSRAEAILPRDTAILYNRGVAAAALGRRDDAVRYYDEVLRLDPANERARANREALVK